MKYTYLLDRMFTILNTVPVRFYSKLAKITKAVQNTNSLKPKLFPVSVSRIFYAPILASCFQAASQSVMGVSASGNAPAVLGSESTPALIGHSFLNPKEANHA